MATTPRKQPLPDSVDYGKSGRTLRSPNLRNKVSTDITQVSADFQNGAAGSKVPSRNYPGVTTRKV